MVAVLITVAVAATAARLLTAPRAANPILLLRLFRDRSFAIAVLKKPSMVKGT